MPDIASLHPFITPYASGMLETADRHRIYWETSGNPDGIPVLFVHGGPGSGTSPVQRRFFAPARYRIVLFDRRGGPGAGAAPGRRRGGGPARGRGGGGDQRGGGRAAPRGGRADGATPRL